jgi:hypothetical protein
VSWFLGPDSRVITALLVSLHDNSAPVRLEAVLALSALGVPKPADLETEKKVLLSALGDPDKNVSIWSGVLLIFLDDGSSLQRPDCYARATLHPKCTQKRDAQRKRTRASSTQVLVLQGAGDRT